MGLKIYNSFTKQKEEFKPINEGKVNMYVCGPTVYGPPHLGHARSYTNFDVVYRYLQYLGYKVKYVQNITDVGHLVGDGDEGEDKIAKQAKKENIDAYEIAYKYETMYFDYMNKLNVLKPSISARATGFIPEMIEMVKEILDKGYAYITDKGNIYFDVRKFSKYGQLSNRTLDNNKSGERIDVASDKRAPEDFAIWKSVEPGTLMKWDSPWGEGCPGWHLECSVLSRRFLGKTFDIHGGGIDNIFPHHECECAQSEVANGVPFVNYFMHNNLVTVNGTKMGKSLGNFITLEDLFKICDPMYVRYFINLFHYRTPVDFTIDAIKKAGEQFEKIKEVYLKASEMAGNEESEIKSDVVKEILNKFELAMDEDFNTPVAISELLKVTKIKLESKEIAGEVLSLMNKIGFVLGLDFSSKEEVKQENSNEEKLLEIIAKVRNQLRAEKNYAMSDFIRDEMAKAGITVQDKKL